MQSTESKIAKAFRFEVAEDVLDGYVLFKVTVQVCSKQLVKSKEGAKLLKMTLESGRD